MAPVPGERLALADDKLLGFEAEQDAGVVERHVERYRQAAAQARRLWGAGGTWLDLGCGTGYGAEVLGQWCERYIGVDVSDRALRYARKYHGGSQREYVWASHRTWPLALGHERLGMPDVVVCIEAYEHMLPAEQAVLLYRVAKYMNEHGVLVLMCPLGNGPNPANPYHLHEPTLEELGDALSRSFRHWRVDATQPYTSTGGQQATQALAVASRKQPIPR